ncbi:LysR family transcriptional regulator [Mesorhizobium sp. SARCC-RB16n]|uniref:LysR family transcriptional regulator n=1 Tax=Mesorhizobium sp. SARCC-RB16n TaxID=2116687 RepID=UPI00122FA86D|nr:LysR family transcriptional regulator [Mesorhizobium sp. SARCC-RB16n]KAA3451791.1 LysR family transcriptional regulator [Mesorhizobium sp. SARCC-RB16n]
MIDLNDLRVFERVAAAGSFSVAGRALGLPKSTVSRNIARLEQGLGARLFQRTTRAVILTAAGEALQSRCTELMSRIDEMVAFVESLNGEPRGLLRISAGIGFGINVLSRHLPEFLTRFPRIDVSLDLTSRDIDLVADRVDVAVRMGPLPDSALVATRLGSVPRCLTASPDYLHRRGTPLTPADLSEHECIEMPRGDGRTRSWHFHRGDQRATVEAHNRVSVNDALTVHQLVRNGAGMGVLSTYLCIDDFARGHLVRLLPDWAIAPVEVNLLFPSKRELSASVRAFVNFMREVTVPDEHWQADFPTEA